MKIKYLVSRKWRKLLLLHLALIISFSYLAILPVGSRLVNDITIVLVTQNNFIINPILQIRNLGFSQVTLDKSTALRNECCLF